MHICDYGCGQEAKYQFKNGKYCCSEKFQYCISFKKKISEKTSGSSNPLYGKKHTVETKNKIRMKAIGRKAWNKGLTRKKIIKEKISKKLKGREPWNKGKYDFSNRRTIEYINKKYPFFFQVEEMRYNPNKPNEKEIQVHCKNHLCENSKEKGGWFTPMGRQIELRIKALEIDDKDNSYFYCSESCKNICPLFGLQTDPYKIKNKKISYTQNEYQQFRDYVLNRDNYKCQYCDDLAEHVHHERPQKLEPFHALDPDLAWSVCSKCHYKYGHKGECSTIKLANKIC